MTRWRCYIWVQQSLAFMRVRRKGPSVYSVSDDGAGVSAPAFVMSGALPRSGSGG